MTDALVDWTTLFTLVTALERRMPEQWSRWVWTSILASANLAWRHSSLVVAPYPGRLGAVIKPFSLIEQAGGGIIRTSETPSPENLTKARRWGTRYRTAIAEAVCGGSASKEFDQWNDWAVSHWYKAHASSTGGLFDKALIPQISLILDCDQGELKRLHAITCDPKVVQRWSKGRSQGADFELAHLAYCTSSIIRGRYYRYHSMSSHRQYLSHPIRNIIHEDYGTVEAMGDDAVFVFLASIVLGGALAQLTLKERVHTWFDGVQRVRAALNHGVAAVRDDNTVDSALRRAVELAKACGVETHPKYVGKLADLAVSLGLGSLGFFLAPWAAFVIGSGYAVVASKYSAGKWTAKRVYSSDKRIENMALRPPGLFRVGSLEV